MAGSLRVVRAAVSNGHWVESCCEHYDFCRTADAIWTTATHCIKRQLERSGFKYEFSQLPHEKLFELLAN